MVTGRAIEGATTRHVPVLLGEVLVQLRAATGGRFLDCTLGGAGHTQAILDANKENTVLACDRDRRALQRAKARLATYGDRVQLVHSPFSKVAEVAGEEPFDGMLADLGVSTDQLWEERGFSFADEAPLDMRMDEGADLTALEVINQTTERELFTLLRQGGVGKEAKAVAQAIVRSRPVSSTKALSDLVVRAAAPYRGKKESHPATVVFQAIRMAVNSELSEIDALMTSAPRLVRNGGRLVVLTFHSLEDQAVTRVMRQWEGTAVSASWPGSFPGERRGRVLTRKAIVSSAEEVERNPASRSAKLRAFEFEK